MINENQGQPPVTPKPASPLLAATQQEEREAIADKIVHKLWQECGLDPYRYEAAKVKVGEILATLSEPKPEEKLGDRGSGYGEVHGPTRPRIHNIKMLRAISAVVLEHSGNEQLADSVRKYLSAESSGIPDASRAGVEEQSLGKTEAPADHAQAVLQKNRTVDSIIRFLRAQIAERRKEIEPPPSGFGCQDHQEFEERKAAFHSRNDRTMTVIAVYENLIADLEHYRAVAPSVVEGVEEKRKDLEEQ